MLCNFYCSPMISRFFSIALIVEHDGSSHHLNVDELSVQICKAKGKAKEVDRILLQSVIVFLAQESMKGMLSHSLQCHQNHMENALRIWRNSTIGRLYIFGQWGYVILHVLDSLRYGCKMHLYSLIYGASRWNGQTVKRMRSQLFKMMQMKYGLDDFLVDRRRSGLLLKHSNKSTAFDSFLIIGKKECTIPFDDNLACMS